MGLLGYMKKSESFFAPNQAQINAGARYDPSVHGTTVRSRLDSPTSAATTSASASREEQPSR